MKSKLSPFVPAAALMFACGCGAYAPWSDRGAGQANVKPAKIYSGGEEPGSPKAAGQEAAPAVSATESTAPGETSPGIAIRTGEEPAGHTGPREEGDTAQEKPELSTEYLISELESKQSLSEGEEDAYRKLIGISPEPEPSAGSRDLYGMLKQARDAVVKGDYESARGHVSQAFAQLRSLTNPVIERVFFATEVRNYGNADVISPAEFAPGKRVLLVTDLSNFTCEPVGGASSAKLYYTKMSQRIAVYDADGNLAWQKSYEAQEYQSEHYVWTMFIPRIFNLPGGLKSGEYTIKVEIVDALANRQAEAGAKFTIK